MSTWSELLQEAACSLQKCGVENYRTEAEILLSELGGFRRSELFFRRDVHVAAPLAEEIRRAVERRAKHEPLQYITGSASFRDIDLQVSSAVLIPRPETELLVDTVLKYLPLKGRFADIGTGSGAIALSVAYERADVTVVAVDASREALDIAVKNRERLGLWGRVEFRHGDLIQPLKAKGEYYHVIAANLPYVSEAEYALCAPEVREHEPVMALVAADNGLELILRLVHNAGSVLVPDGWLMLEIGSTQGAEVAAAMNNAGFKDVSVRQDLTNRTRFVIGRYPGGGILY